jgi:predicted nuclease of predicted toxin-antitoxin system
MKQVKIDEHLPIEFAGVLAEAGHDAATVIDEGHKGSKDPPLLERCVQEGRALMTLDLDFADVRSYPPGQYPGLIVFRVRRQDKSYMLDLLRRLLSALEREPLVGYLWIVEDARIRIRGDADR